jgi:hypothetical protein
MNRTRISTRVVTAVAVLVGALCSAAPPVQGARPQYPGGNRFDSLPGAAQTIVLDVDGENMSGSSWLAQGAPASVAAPAGLTDEQLYDVWWRVSEAFRPWNVNVTTTPQNAANLTRSSIADNRYGVKVVLTSSSSTGFCSNACVSASRVGQYGAVRPASADPIVVFNELDESWIVTAIAHQLGMVGARPSGSWQNPIDTGDWRVHRWMHAPDRVALDAAFGRRADDIDVVDVGPIAVVAAQAGLQPDSGVPRLDGIIERGDDVDRFRFTIAADALVTMSFRDANSPTWEHFRMAFRNTVTGQVRIQMGGDDGGSPYHPAQLQAGTWDVELSARRDAMNGVVEENLGSYSIERVWARPVNTVVRVVPAEILSNFTALVDWHVPHEGDWVALARPGDPLATYLAGKPISVTPRGYEPLEFQFQVETPGEYEVRVFSRGTYSLIARSDTLTVLPLSVPWLVESRSGYSVMTNSPLTALVRQRVPRRTNWVALARAGSPLTEYLESKYTNNTATPISPTTPLVAEAMNVVFNGPQVPGTYVMRLFEANSYVLLDESAPIVVQGVNSTVVVSSPSVARGAQFVATVANGPGNASDWLGITPLAGGTYVSFAYLNGTSVAPAAPLVNASVSLRAPSAPGAYEVCLYRNNTYDRVACTSLTTT